MTPLKTRPELRPALIDSWQRSHDAYHYLARKDGEPVSDDTKPPVRDLDKKLAEAGIQYDVTEWYPCDPGDEAQAVSGTEKPAWFDSYFAMVRQFPLRSIRSFDQLVAALKVMKGIEHSFAPTEGEIEYYETLHQLAWLYIEDNGLEKEVLGVDLSKSPFNLDRSNHGHA